MKDNINKAIAFLNEKNIIKKDEVDFIKKEGELVKYLISSGINQDIIKNILRDYFGRTFLKPDEIDSFEGIYKANFGFLIENNYYVKMETYYSSNIIKKINSNYSGVLFDKIRIISESDYERIENRYNEISIDVKNRNLNIINTTFMEMFNDMMNSDYKKVFVDNRNNFFMKYYDSFTEKELSETFSNVSVDVMISVLDEMVDEKSFYKNNEHYKIFYRKVSDTAIEVEISPYYKKERNVKEFDNYKDIISNVSNLSGLFIFSQKEQYNYFYEVLDTLTNESEKRVLVLSEGKRKTTATKNIDIENIEQIKEIDEDIIRDFDLLMIENTNFLKSDTFKTINLFLSNSKKVVLFVTSKDAINSLGNVIYNYPEIHRDILTEYLNGIFHVSQLPKLCEHCKKPIKLIDVENIRDDYPDLLTKYDRKEIIYLRNNKGCTKCNHGYDGNVQLEQFIRKTGVLVSNILDFNITTIKNQLSAENNYRSIEDKAEDFVMKEKVLSIRDVQNRL